MKTQRCSWGWFLIFSIAAALTVSACQRNNSGVQAAREDKAPANTTANANDVMTTADQGLAAEIQQSHQSEIDMATLAKDHANSKDVKDYANMLIDDHNSALKKLTGMMNDKHVTVTPQPIPADAQRNMDNLRKLRGTAFDREFLNTMVSDHTTVLAKLNEARGTVENQDMKDYINDLIPKVQKHLEKAQDLQSKLGTAGTKSGK